MSAPQELLKKLEWLENQLVQRATGGTMDDGEYLTLRQELMGEEQVRDKLPDFLQRCSVRRIEKTARSLKLVGVPKYSG